MARLHPAVPATAVALPLALVVGVVVAAVLAQRAPAREDVALGTVPAPAATSGPCTTLLPALPQELDSLVRATLAQPAPEGAVAWQPTDPAAVPSDPVVLRCGIDRPAEFDVAAPLVVVDGVQVLEIPGTAVGIAATTYVVVDRGVYIGITLPNGSGSGALQQIADVVRDTLPAQPLDPAPIG